MNLLAHIRAALAALFAAPRWILERCADSGVWVWRQVAGTIDGLFMPAPVGPDMSKTPYALPELKRAAPEADAVQADETVELVQKAAKEFAAGVENAATLSGLPDKLLSWLSVMDREMLCQIVCASPKSVREHLDGKGRGLQRVIACDRKAIEMYVEARQRKLRQDDESLESMLDEDFQPASAA